MSIQRKIIGVGELTTKQKDEMFSLMLTYYSNTIRETFDCDLSEKNWVLMLREEESSKIVGFSTQMVFPFTYNSQKINVLFSGDTIIEKEHWGSMGLSLLFGELMIKLIDQYHDQELYWMLISKGLRTYKYLPTFFLEYYPCHACPTPPEIQGLMHQLGEIRYPNNYDKKMGVVKAKQEAQFLKEAYHSDPKSKKKHEMFFYEKNPGYSVGDELLCLTRLSFDNITPFIKRQISKFA